MEQASDFLAFTDVCSRVSISELSVSDAFELVKSIDYSQFSLEEMQAFEEADWLPDDFYVATMQDWLERQSEQIDRIRSYLFVTSTVPNSLALAFIDTVFRPAKSICLERDNIIYLLATAGNTREYVNPCTKGLVTVTCDGGIRLHPVEHVFSDNPEEFFQSASKPNTFLVVTLPPFLRVCLTKYTLQGPPKLGGMRSWTLEVSKDGEQWVEVASERGRPELEGPSKRATFVLEKRTPPVRFFKLTNRDQNFANYHAMLLAGFDVSGEVQLCLEC